MCVSKIVHFTKGKRRLGGGRGQKLPVLRRQMYFIDDPYVIDATKMPLNYARPLTKELDSRSLKNVTPVRALKTKYFSKVINNQSMGEEREKEILKYPLSAGVGAAWLAVSLYI